MPLYRQSLATHQAPAAIDLISVGVISFQSVSPKQNHARHIVLRLAFALGIMLYEIHPCSCKYQQIILL